MFDIFNTLDDDNMFPVITKIITVEEGVAGHEQPVKGNFAFIVDLSFVSLAFGIGCSKRPIAKLEFMEMGICPAERSLYEMMKFSEAHSAINLDFAPDNWLDLMRL